MTIGGAALFLISNLVLLLIAMAALWLISVRIKDASIVDIFWGPACAFGGVLTFLRLDDAAPRDVLLTALVCLWAARLSIHLARRNLGHGEDYRYRAMRAKQGSDAAFARWSLPWVFGLQGAVAFVVSLPAQIGQMGPDAALGIFAWIGLAVFALGFSFETIGDWQLATFKKDPANKGRLMTRGLWRWTRHPNYFGDATVWCGLALIAVEAPFGAVALISPLVMTHFLVNVSGKALLEKGLVRKYPEYAAYRKRTSGFFPFPPKN